MKKWYKFAVITVIVMFSFLSMSLQSFAATTNNLFDGQMSITDSVGNGSGTPESYSITAKGSLLSKKTNNITITNETDVDAVIGFSYSATKANSFKIDGGDVPASGDYSATVSAGGTIKIVLTSNSGLSNTTATLTLTNITYAQTLPSSDVQVEFIDSLGAVTAGGETISGGSIVNIGESGLEFVATPATGATFVAWVGEDDKIISRDYSYTQKSVGNITVKALFSKDTPYFMVDNIYIISNLNEAVKKGNKVVLICDGVLPECDDDYKIPRGVTLLIPFDDNNTIYTDKPEGVNKETVGDYKPPVAYRTLTMASGANIIINGTISLSAKHFAAGGAKSNSGSPVGNVSFIKMEKDSSITVEDGGKLYAWGFIIGDGTVTAKSGSEVFEYFQVTDFRGGSQTTIMKSGVFPFSQYYIQNIEVPMTVYSGAKETAYTSVCMFGSTVAGSSVNFFGKTDAMFNLTEGYVVKKYDGSTDRLYVELKGDMEISSVAVSISIYSINSKNFELPINSNITIDIRNGSNVYINQDVNLLPGAVIKIEEGANGFLGAGKSVYVYDADEWGGYCGPSNSKLIPLTYAPGRVDNYIRTEANLEDAKVVVNGTFDASQGYVYTTKSGADVISTGTGKVLLRQGNSPSTSQLKQADPVSNSENVSIEITTAKLKNSDGTYTEPAVLEGCCATYIYSGGKWVSKKATNTNYSISNENIVINTSLILDVPSDTQIIIATYDSYERLLDAVCCTADSLEEISSPSVGVAKIKVFAWDGVNLMNPISGVEEIVL